MSVYSGPPPQLTLEEGALIAQNGLIFQVVCTGVVLWDHISTLDLEIELIWKKKLSLVQLLYFTNRYVGDAVFMYGTALLLWVPNPRFQELCPSFGRTITWLSIVALGSMQGIMVHRIVSMYRHNKKILFSLLATFFIEFSAALVMGGFNVQVVNIPVMYNPTLRTCIPTNFPAWSSALWFLMMGFDLLIFVMAIREGLRYAKESRERRVRARKTTGIFVDNNSSRESTLLGILLRDSIVFPFIGLLMCLFNALAWYVLPLGALQYTMNIAAAGSPILGCRLILNLRDAYYRPFGDEIRYTVKGRPEPDSPDLSPELSPERDHFEMPITMQIPAPGSMVTISSR